MNSALFSSLSLFPVWLLAQQFSLKTITSTEEQVFWAAVVLGLFCFGIVSFALEVFVIPGVGFAAILSLVSFIASVGICFYRFPPVVSIVFFFISMVVVGLMLYWLLVVFPKTSFSDGFIHKTTLAKGEKIHSAQDFDELMGCEGEVIVDCRPSGKARFNNKKYSVVSAAGFLKKGERVKVICTDSNEIEVDRLEE